MARIQDSSFFIRAINDHCQDPLSSSVQQIEQQRLIISSSQNIETLLVSTLSSFLAQDSDIPATPVGQETLRE